MDFEKMWPAGPWEYLKDDYPGLEDTIVGGEGRIQQKDGGLTICQMADLAHEEIGARQLIASSPRLFDALEHAEHVLRIVAKESGLTHSDAESCADESLAALSEAVGINLGES